MILTNPLLNDQLAAILLGTNGDYTAQALAFYDGTPPNSIGDTPAGNVLCSVPLGANWGTYNNVSLITLNNPTSATITTAGTCSFFRMTATHSAAQVALLQGSVTTTGNGGDIQFNYLNWPAGVDIDINNFSIQLPTTTQ